jgi:hypothetical protein
VSVTHAGSPTAALSTVSVQVPNGATTGSLTVDNGHGTATYAKQFTILSAPTLVAFSPAYGVAGNKVTIQGDNLAQVTEVDFQGTTAPGTTLSAKPSLSKDHSSITVVVPKGTKTAPIMAQNELILKVADPANPSNTSLTDESGNVVFTVVQKPANVHADDLGHDHVAGQQIELDGQNLQGITSVTFGKVKASFSAVGNGSGGIDTTKLSVTIPAGATSNKITVANAAGSFNTAVFPILAITKVIPTHAKVGKTVVISGSGFKPSGSLADTTVEFGAQSATVPTNATDTSIKVTVPSGATDGITVTTDLGTVTFSFTVDPS